MGREKFRVNRFPNKEGKSYFLHSLALSVKHFLHFLLGIVGKYAKKKQFDHGFKI